MLGDARKQSNRFFNGFGAASKANFITELHLESTKAAAASIRAGQGKARAAASNRSGQGYARVAVPFRAGQRKSSGTASCRARPKSCLQKETERGIHIRVAVVCILHILAF